MTVFFYKKHPDAVIPDFATPYSACMDLTTVESIDADLSNLAWPPVVVARFGLIAKVEPGYHLEVYLRSSTPRKYGVMVPHSVGIIDQDYCGPDDELILPLLVLEEHVKIPKGSRIAQLKLCKTIRHEIREVLYETLKDDKSRGGYGSTGE